MLIPSKYSRPLNTACAADAFGAFSTLVKSRVRTSWMASNIIPDSIITNMICRSLVPLELKLRSTEVLLAALTSKNTLRILNTIKPVTRPFTVMVAMKLVVVSGIQGVFEAGTNQVAKGYKLKSAHQTKID